LPAERARPAGATLCQWLDNPAARTGALGVRAGRGPGAIIVAKVMAGPRVQDSGLRTQDSGLRTQAPGPRPQVRVRVRHVLLLQ